MPQLLGLDEKNIFNLTTGEQNGDYNNQSIGDNWNVNPSPNEQIEYKHKLEKANLIIAEREKEIDYLKQQMNDLREVIDLLKKQDKK